MNCGAGPTRRLAGSRRPAAQLRPYHNYGLTWPRPTPLTGDTERAAADLAEARRLSPDDRYSSIVHLKERSLWGVPKAQELFEATYVVGLRKAGMSEQ
jgi:hypothetical protein